MAQLLYFGKLGDLAGQTSEDIALPRGIDNSAALRRWLDGKLKADGAFLELSVKICINDEMCHEPCPVCDEDKIAFLPPVGGG